MELKRTDEFSANAVRIALTSGLARKQGLCCENFLSDPFSSLALRRDELCMISNDDIATARSY